MNQRLSKALGVRPHDRLRMRLGLWVALALGLSACGGSPRAVPDGITVADGEDYISFSSRDSAYVDSSYRLGPGDEIDLSFLFDHSMDARYLIRPDGGVNLPILGDMVVAGRTPGDLSRQIGQAYARYYTNPQLTINLVKLAPPQCYVLGEVRYPRVVEIRPGMTVLTAVVAAGGPTESARLSSTLVLRRVTGNQAVGRRVNLAAVAKGERLSSDLFLQDFDIIYVPRTFLGKLNAAIEQLFSKTVLIPQFYMRGWEAFNTDRVYRFYPPETTTTTRSPGDQNTPEGP